MGYCLFPRADIRVVAVRECPVPCVAASVFVRVWFEPGRRTPADSAADGRVATKAEDRAAA